MGLNQHGILQAAPFVSPFKASFVHRFRKRGPSANAEKLGTRAGYAPCGRFPCWNQKRWAEISWAKRCQHPQHTVEQSFDPHKGPRFPRQEER